tara:strand:- start:617 stop:772 length:156 start_codon:yes stop_codon:yes gene_type:complete
MGRVEGGLGTAKVVADAEDGLDLVAQATVMVVVGTAAVAVVAALEKLDQSR